MAIFLNSKVVGFIKPNDNHYINFEKKIMEMTTYLLLTNANNS